MKRKFEAHPPENEVNSTGEKRATTFTFFYEKNINWMDDDSINPIALLQSVFPTYFQGDTPDYTKIRDDILVPYIKKPQNKAHELFKSLFKMPYKNTKRISSDDLENLEREFGAVIMAHGVEEAKGGMYNLLLMCISNQVRVPSVSWGSFISGAPNISPVGHGPYYLIYSMPCMNQSSTPGNNAKLSDVARILVPFLENKQMLINALEAMVRVNLITPESKEMFINKLVTYQELLSELRAQLKIKETPGALNSYSFFNSTSPRPATSGDNDIAVEPCFSTPDV